jgi:hypothetical protein
MATLSAIGAVDHLLVRLDGMPEARRISIEESGSEALTDRALPFAAGHDSVTTDSAVGLWISWGNAMDGTRSLKRVGSPSERLAERRDSNPRGPHDPTGLASRLHTGCI